MEEKINQEIDLLVDLKGQIEGVIGQLEREEMGRDRQPAECRKHHGQELEPGGPGAAEDAGRPDLHQGQAVTE